MNCRFGTEQVAPFEIAAGEFVRLDCTIETVQPGPFEGQLHVFLDDRGLREVVLKVHGEAREADDGNESTEKPKKTIVAAKKRE